MPSLDEKYTMEGGHEPSRKRRCWNELKSTRMLKWGKRKNVQFLYETEKLDGDDLTQEPVCSMEFNLLKEAMARMERNMQELLLKKQEDAVVVSCVTSQNFDHENFLLPLKVIVEKLKSSVEETNEESSSSSSSPSFTLFPWKLYKMLI